ncbi:MAG: phosphoesterase [Bacteroidales bacterium]|nr:phosphoesterase [Bacteroidales bacterium]
MIIQIASDLHNEFGILDLDFESIDLLILAGDIHVGERGLLWIKEQVKKVPVLYVLGNHEYYRNSYPKLLKKLKEGSRESNIHILEKDSITIDGITFHGTTLWTNFELFGNPRIAGIEAQQKMNDYKLIRIDPSYSKLRSIDTHLFHYESLEWLRNSLEKSKTSKNVIITHHGPSILSLLPEYREELISAAFVSNLEDFIKEMKPELWIHGHIHNCLDYTIENTRVICNPRGYPDEPYNGFNNKLLIKISA